MWWRPLERESGAIRQAGGGETVTDTVCHTTTAAATLQHSSKWRSRLVRILTGRPDEKEELGCHRDLVPPTCGDWAGGADRFGRLCWLRVSSPPLCGRPPARRNQSFLYASLLYYCSAGPHYKVRCTRDTLRVDVVKEEGARLYLQHLRDYPEPACKPEIVGSRATFSLSLTDIYQCMVTRVRNR